MKTKKRQIYLEDALKAISSEYLEGTLPEHDLVLLLAARRKLKNLPTVDAVEVVRCKYCKYWIPEEPERCKALKQEPYGLCNRYPQRTDWHDTTDHDDFCSYGERKTEDEG